MAVKTENSASREFLYSIHGLFETFNGFQPARASRRVIFENFVPSLIVHDSLTQKLSNSKNCRGGNGPV